MNETGRGYRAAEREFGVPRSTIQGWKRGKKASKPRRPRAHARAPAPARARENAAELQDTEGALPVDENQPPAPPADEDYVAFLQRKIGELEADRAKASQAGHSQSVVRLQDLTGKYRQKLEAELQARDAVARAAGDMPDPAAVAKQFLDLVPLLARLHPELAQRMAAALEAAVG